MIDTQRLGNKGNQTEQKDFGAEINYFLLKIKYELLLFD